VADNPFSFIETLSPEQQAVVTHPLAGSLFLEGPAGTGKSAAGVARLLHLVNQGIPAESILVLVPQRTLAFPFYQALRDPNFPAGGSPDIATLGGLGQRMIDLFWPTIAPSAGFSHPHSPPSFLTLETAQYYLSRIVDPLITNLGYFDSITIDRNRLLSQILDNLNKAAAVGFPYDTIADRLKSAYAGKGIQPRVFDEAQEAGVRFRHFCLENNLLDFSLQLEVFVNTFWRDPAGKRYLTARYRHLIFDNLEEDVPVVHQVVKEWLPDFDSALLIYDHSGGFRTFLGADSEGGYELKSSCQWEMEFSQSFIISEPLSAFSQALEASLAHQAVHLQEDITPAVRFSYEQFLHQTTNLIGSQIHALVQNEGIALRDIVILAPFMSDSLRFSLMRRLSELGIPSRSHRPSRSLAEEPATHCLLTLAMLAHPQWNLRPSRQDLRIAFMQAIDAIDLVRSDLLSRFTYQESRFQEGLKPFETILPEMRERITFSIGAHYQQLRAWLNEYRQEEPAELDVFLSRLFGEILSQEGYGFHDQYDSAAVAARLVESVQKFRRGTFQENQPPAGETGKEYITMVKDGVLAAQYLYNWEVPEDNSVLISPAYTFLMSNRPVRCQFWLDIGSLAWWERLSQPLTHPYVLSRRWKPGTIWTDADDFRFNQDALCRLATGLIHRCSDRIFLCATGVSEQGDEQRGPLLQAIQQLIRHFPEQMGVSLV
jgi:hypothetical protein